MKKTVKIFMMLIVMIIVPALASLAIMALWNGVIAAVCGFGAITYWQSLGMFVLGQLLSGGFVLLLFMLFGSLHAIVHRGHGDWHRHWHNMSDDDRREFIRRRSELFGLGNHSHKEENATKG